jgi:ABC-type nitrate/sulfonate/bicarbonate transport system permease component
VRAIAALPSLLAALKVAAPTAVVGAVVGEELGGTSNVGLGYAMIASEQQLDVPRTWGIALVLALVGGIGYILIGLIQRLATPWAANATAGADQ